MCGAFRTRFVWFPWSRSAQIAEWFRSEGLFIYANGKREVEIAWNTKRQKKSILEFVSITVALVTSFAEDTARYERVVKLGRSVSFRWYTRMSEREIE